MVGSPGKSWKSVNSSNKVFLKTLRGSQVGRSDNLKIHLMYYVSIMYPRKKKTFRGLESSRNLFLKKGTNPAYSWAARKNDQSKSTII